MVGAYRPWRVMRIPPFGRKVIMTSGSTRSCASFRLYRRPISARSNGPSTVAKYIHKQARGPAPMGYRRTAQPAGVQPSLRNKAVRVAPERGVTVQVVRADENDCASRRQREPPTIAPVVRLTLDGRNWWIQAE